MKAACIISNLGNKLIASFSVFPALLNPLLRPGWKEFLRETSIKYEMHIYTMGTRAYAEEVCAAIDPEGSLFGGRIISRDESGSAFCRLHLALLN